MKFIASFQCLMGGNGVSPSQFQTISSPSSSSSVVSLDDTIKTKKNKSKPKRKSNVNENEKVIKLFKPDGEIKIFEKPVRVSEIMSEEYLVCRSDSFYIGQKIPSLSQNEQLQLGHVYFLLPSRLFHSVLSFVTIASFTAGSSSSEQNNTVNDDDHTKMKAAFLKKAATSSCPPFDIHKTPSGTLRIRISDEFISQLLVDQTKAAATTSDDLLCTSPLLHREYEQLVVGSRRCWKPKLEMIQETGKARRKVKLMLSASFTRMKTKLNKKKKNKVVLTSGDSSSSNSTNPKKNKSLKTKKTKKTKNNKKSGKPVLSPRTSVGQIKSSNGKFKGFNKKAAL